MPGEASDITLTWPELAGGALALLTIVAMLLAGLMWVIKREIRAQSQPMEQMAQATQHVARQVSTSNGHTMGQYVEEIKGEIGVLVDWAGQNRDLASRAYTLAHQADQRIRAHERKDHH